MPKCVVDLETLASKSEEPTSQGVTCGNNFTLISVLFLNFVTIFFIIIIIEKNLFATGIIIVAID